MRVYKVENKKGSLIVAAHTPHQAYQIANLKGAIVEEVNIKEPVIICKNG